MPWIDHCSAVLLVSRELVHVRFLESDEQIAPAREADIPALLEIAEGAHGRGARTAETFKARFARGMEAYLLQKAGRPASYLWAAEKSYEIYPVRLRLEVPEGDRYFFDETTAPAYRRQGMLGKLMRFAWSACSMHMGVICIRADNQASLVANSRIGFWPVSTVSVTQFFPLRLHKICRPREAAAQWFFSRPRLGMNHFILNCRFAPDGQLEVGWATAPLSIQARPLTDCDLV